MRLACTRLREQVGEVSPPIGLKKLVNALGGSIRLGNIATYGRLEAGTNEYVIRVRRDRSWRAQRFTVAHELGHILLLNALARTPKRLSVLRTPSAWGAVERLCNLAAAELLMPQEDFQRQLQAVPFSPAGILSLYDRYLVSYRVLFVRMASALKESTVTLWRHHSREPGDRVALRVIWKSRSPDGPWLPTGITINYIVPDIVSAALRDGHTANPSLRLEVRGRPDRVHAVASAAPRREDSNESQLPIFQGRPIADDPKLDFEAVLLMSRGARSLPESFWAEQPS